MARIFITGSADGLGLMAGKRLVEQGHEVTLHARNDARAKEAKAQLPGAKRVIVGDVETLAAMRKVAEQANEAGQFDAVIHNVAIGYREPKRVETSDGIERLFAINVLAPYVLTALIEQPKRLIYLSSGLHRGGEPEMDDPEFKSRAWSGSQAYSNSKLDNTALAFAIALRWPEVLSNALEPGWVATKMGGAGAPDDLQAGCETQAWLAVSDDAAATVTGSYFFHHKTKAVSAAARDADFQDALLAYCESRSGIALPEHDGGA